MTSSSSWYSGSSGYSYYNRPFAEVRNALTPLLRRLHAYDLARNKLEKKGGDLRQLTRITAQLSEPITLRNNGASYKCSLTNPDSLRDALRGIGARNLSFAVRLRPTGMPTYYLVRVKHGYWSEYSLLVEDLHKSPDYPNPDERFVKLKDLGRETYFLRLSQFRDEVADRMSGGEYARDRDVDEALHNVGRQVFQAAWHEDQYPAFQAAEHFGLPNFRRAIEMLYLCLSGDLCAIRASLDPQILDFFAGVYPQAAIHAFLERIGELDGNTLARLPEDALAVFARLSRCYRRFLRVEVNNGTRACSVPLYKLLFANFGRLERVAPDLAGASEIAAAIASLEEASAQAIRQIAHGEVGKS